MYTRRWVPLKWFDRVRNHERIGLQAFPELFHIYRNNPPYPTPSGRPPKAALDRSAESELIRDLMKRYPDLQFTTTTYSNSGNHGLMAGNYIYDFIFHQQKLMRNGYNKQKAFELTEKKFQDRFAQKIEAAQAATKLAFNNNARSLLSLAQQQSELEAHLKVKRITRDLPLYKEAQAQMNRTLKDLERERNVQEEEDEDFEEEDFVEFGAGSNEATSQEEESFNPGEEYAKSYKRVLYKIVPEKKEVDNPYDQYANKERRTNIIESFTENTKNMFNMYYDRAAALDKLSGLTEKEIMDTVVATPKRIKKQSQKLLQKLQKYNIKLDPSGEVDFTQCTYPNIAKKYINNPLVKAVLMQADLEYEFPHREVRMEATRKVRQEFEESKKDREKEKQLAEEEERRRLEAELGSTSEQSPFHQQFDIQYPQSEKYRVRVKTETARERAQKYARANPDETLSAEATYRVFETYDERMVRLEKKWLKTRLATLEGGVERPTDDEKKDLLNMAVEKLRRLKFLVDQKNMENAKDLLFKEHRVFTKGELLRDSGNHYEKLHDYLKLPDEKRRLHTINEIDDNKILTMIKRKEIVEDTNKPYQDSYMNVLTENDTVEEKLRKIQDKLDQKVVEKFEQSVGHDGKKSQYDQEEDDSEMIEMMNKAEESDRAAAAQKEKKKLVDYIKTSTKGKQKGKGKKK